MTPSIARRMIEMFASAPLYSSPVPPLGAHPVLTAREVRVLQHMVQGRARKQITEDLGINSHTLDYVVTVFTASCRSIPGRRGLRGRSRRNCQAIAL